ncbi:MAG: hypothetical protein ABWY12_09540 [Burkholderiales bacterium]
MGGRVATRGGQCRHSDLGFCAQSRPAQLTGYRCDQYFDALAFASDALVHVTFEAQRREGAAEVAKKLRELAAQVEARSK